MIALNTLKLTLDVLHFFFHFSNSEYQQIRITRGSTYVPFPWKAEAHLSGGTTRAKGVDWWPQVVLSFLDLFFSLFQTSQSTKMLFQCKDALLLVAREAPRVTLHVFLFLQLEFVLVFISNQRVNQDAVSMQGCAPFWWHETRHGWPYMYSFFCNLSLC